MDPFEPLRRDVSFLGRILGDTLVEQEGEALLDVEERIRALAKERRAARTRRERRAASSALAQAVAELDTSLAERVARAFTHYFQLVNLAEQHHRTRRRRDYARAGRPQRGSFEAVFGELRRRVPAERFAAALEDLTIELVFTAHPSEAQRRTVLEKHRRLIELLARRERPDATPAEQAEVERDVRQEIALLWQTDEIRQERPRVGDEVKNALFYLEEVLFPLIPRFYDAFEAASGAERVPTVLRFGSWVGADMDGNPNVTPEVAVDTGLAQTARVLDRYAAAVVELGAALSQSTRRVTVGNGLLASLEHDAARMPELARTLVGTTHHEPYRRKLRFVLERLVAARSAVVDLRRRLASGEAGATLELPPEAYDGVDAFLADLDTIRASLADNRGSRAGLGLVRDLVRQVETFGFHLARLDVRIPAAWVRADVRTVLGLAEDAPVDRAVLEAALARDPSSLSRPDGAGFRAACAIARLREVTFGGGAESWILSMTHGAEDVLGALLLARIAGIDREVSIVPLFETLDDLERSAPELEAAARSPAYAAYLAQRGVQEVMLGYSDSNKDVGIVGSSFALYRAQQHLVAVSHEHGLRLKVFHGRGGSIGRGGGPAQRALASLPEGAIGGRFKLTEQGEVLGWKYLVPELAERNLEITVAGVIAHGLGTDTDGHANEPSASNPTIAEAEAIFEEAARVSIAHYKRLIDDPELPTYYAATTPIDEISQLNIGSRPARRPGGAGSGPPRLEDLRAIPWVFAWTQSRQLVPGWFGAGVALRFLLRKHGAPRIRRMLAEWPFFATTVDAIAAALAQADIPIAAGYARLLDREHPARRLFLQIALDHGRAVRAIRTIFDRSTLLDPESTLARSIELRNPYVDPLSFIQIELLRRKRSGAKADPVLERAILLTINGLAAGMRSTG